MPEVGNRYDQYAVQVVVPRMENVPRNFQDWHVGDASIQDIAGRMPRHLCNVVSLGMQVHHTVQHAGCFFTGEIVQGGPVVGGGPQLRAMYVLEIVEEGRNVLEMANDLRRHLEGCHVFVAY